MLLHINPQCSPKCAVAWVGVGQQLSQICCWCEMQFLWRHPWNPDMQGLPWFTPPADLAQIWDAESQEGTWYSPWDPGLRQRLLLKSGICAAGRHWHFPAAGSRAAGRFCEAEEKLLLPSFSFCWLVAVSGGSLCLFLRDICRGAAAAAGQEHPSHGAALGDSPMTLKFLWSASFPGVGSGFAVWKSLKISKGFGEEKGCWRSYLWEEQDRVLQLSSDLLHLFLKYPSGYWLIFKFIFSIFLGFFLVLNGI